MCDVDIDKLEKALRGLVETMFEDYSRGTYYEGQYNQDIKNVINALKTNNEGK